MLLFDDLNQWHIPKNAIVHTDHESCYLSYEFTKILKEFNWKKYISKVVN